MCVMRRRQRNFVPFSRPGGVRMIGGDGLFSDMEDHYGYDWRDSVDAVDER